MSYGKTLRVRAVAGCLVTDIAAMDANIRRYVGRKAVVNAAGSVDWVNTGEPCELPYDPYYTDAAKNGELEVLDAETAKICGVPFKAAVEPKKGS